MDVDVGARGTVVLAPPSLRLTALPPLSCALAGRLEAELAEVQSWPAEDLRTGHQGAVLAAVARLQALLVEQSGETTRLIAEAAELEGRLQQARAELRTTAAGVNDAAAASLHADPAGLRAAVAAAEEAEHAAQEQAARSAQRVEQTHAQLREAEVLHAREASLDSHISALCAADAQLAREWREGSWAVSEFVGGTLLAAPVEQLGHELLAAQREELELELRPAAAASCSDGGLEAPPPLLRCCGWTPWPRSRRQSMPQRCLRALLPSWSSCSRWRASGVPLQSARLRGCRSCSRVQSRQRQRRRARRPRWRRSCGS